MLPRKDWHSCIEICHAKLNLPHALPTTAYDVGLSYRYATDEKQEVENAETEGKPRETPPDTDLTQKNIEDQPEKYRGNRCCVRNAVVQYVRDPADPEEQQQNDILYQQL